MNITTAIEVLPSDLINYIGHELELDGRWERITAVAPSAVQGVDVTTTEATYQFALNIPTVVNGSTYWGDTAWAARNVGCN